MKPIHELIYHITTTYGSSAREWLVKGVEPVNTSGEVGLQGLRNAYLELFESLGFPPTKLDVKWTTILIEIENELLANGNVSYKGEAADFVKGFKVVSADSIIKNGYVGVEPVLIQTVSGTPCSKAGKALGKSLGVGVTDQPGEVLANLIAAPLDVPVAIEITGEWWGLSANREVSERYFTKYGFTGGIFGTRMGVYEGTLSNAETVITTWDKNILDEPGKVRNVENGREVYFVPTESNRYADDSPEMGLIVSTLGTLRAHKYGTTHAHKTLHHVLSLLAYGGKGSDKEMRGYDFDRTALPPEGVMYLEDLNNYRETSYSRGLLTQWLTTNAPGKLGW